MMYSQGFETKPLKLEFEGFLALGNPMLSQEYLEGHQGVLRSFNIPKVGSEDALWMRKEGSLVVVVRDILSNQLIGGGRLEIAEGTYSLPLAEIMTQLDEGFDVSKYFNPEKKTAELSGLWTERSGRIKGLSTSIISMLNICGRRLNIDSGAALCSPFSIKRFLAAGWSLVEELGEEGYFYYPNEMYKSAFMVKEFQGRYGRGEREIFNATIKGNIHTSIETRTTGNFVFDYDLRALPMKIKI